MRGRADGYDPDANRLEEVKTYRGDLDAQPANHRQLHWAQVKVYGWLMCQKLGLTDIDLALVYFDIVGEGETLLHQRYSATELETFFQRPVRAVPRMGPAGNAAPRRPQQRRANPGVSARRVSHRPTLACGDGL